MDRCRKLQDARLGALGSLLVPLHDVDALERHPPRLGVGAKDTGPLALVVAGHHLNHVTLGDVELDARLGRVVHPAALLVNQRLHVR
jgi:hypothetical protein